MWIMLYLKDRKRVLYYTIEFNNKDDVWYRWFEKSKIWNATRLNFSIILFTYLFLNKHQ